ncbi:MAG: oligosaccharide flippase family protein [Chloroflexi bacterium]|nr:oligosaccharide flippase family protein [Chloroflexota bacterium]
MRKPTLRIDLAILMGYLLTALLFFWPVTLGGKTILPADNAFAWAPWKEYAAQEGITVPHNELLSDLYLENYAWKRFIVDSLQRRELPLWNPYILSGVPFLAAGQHSALYPLSVLFYVLPLPAAYGWFAALHLFLAGTWIYLFARVLRMGRLGSGLAGLSFMLSGFMVTRQVFPMIVAAAVWLPLLLTAIELLARHVEKGEGSPFSYIPAAALGAVAFGLSLLAGHPEMYYYVALTAGFYALWRLALVYRRRHSPGSVLSLAGWLLGMMLLGLGLGAGQWVPLFDLVRHNFRVGSASLRDVLGWAYPPRRIISLLIPDFFGNPAHHGYWDLYTWRWVPVTQNALGEPIHTIYWGIKNYVEGASYLGTLPTLLALIGLLCPGRGQSARRHVPFFGALAALSLSFVFGTPLYALIYYLPGLNQVHSPFRWIYPYSLCMALLAGLGAEALISGDDEGVLSARIRRFLAREFIPRGALWAGLALLAGLGFSLLIKEQMATLAGRLLPHLALAPQAFADGRAFYSYEFRNLMLFALALAAGGATLVARRALQRRRLWSALCALLIGGELFVIGHSFFPAVDPSLVAYRTPGIEFLQKEGGLYRITSYGADKTFNANAGMWYGIADARGYDSIIPQQYARYMEGIQPQSELQYNRIAPLYPHYPEVLDSPLLDMLNVRYVLTAPDRPLNHEDFTLVYEGEMRIYRHEDGLPRAYWVPRAQIIGDDQARAAALRTFDPRQSVILEDAAAPRPDAPWPAAADPAAPIQEIVYTPNEVTITVETIMPGYLVLADAYSEGWLAFIRPFDAETPQLAEQKIDIYRANGNFRAVYLPAGHHVVRFKYSPDNVKFGLYISFLSAMVFLLGLALWGWTRFYAGQGQEIVERRVTKNTLAPIALSLVNKAIDMAFAMLMLRILGPVDSGQYALAVVIIGWFDILTNFGLNTLLTREVAKDREHANRYLSNTLMLRVILWVAAIPMLLGFFGLRQLTKPLEPTTMLAIGVFGLGLLPSNMSASFSAVFNAYERMEIPASVTTLTTLLKVFFGTVALILGTGYLGLAVVSILVNLITMAVLYGLLRRTLFRPRAEIDWPFQWRMVLDSYPLMINLLLATLFFKVAMLLLEWLIPEPRVLGWYGAAYKYVDAVQVIPAYFTMAIFPLMSRYAADDHEALLRTYRLATKLLLLVALPCALIGWALAGPLLAILAGSQYLPQAADILRVMIWYMPVGFINSVTQYILIALNQQRFLTRAFAIGLVFNILANLALISRFGFMAAAYVAVASEIALLIPFLFGIRRHLGHVPWLSWSWKPALSTAPVLLLVAFLPDRYRLLGVVLGLGVYMLCLVGLGAFDIEERAALGRVLPLREWADRGQQRLGRLLGLFPTPRQR